MNDNLKSMLFPPKVFTIEDLQKAREESDEQVIKELGEQGCISFGIIGKDGKFTETAKFEPKSKK